jgi:hypothetical protein
MVIERPALILTMAISIAVEFGFKEPDGECKTVKAPETNDHFSIFRTVMIAS